MPLAISTNIAAEKANYYLGYNADKVQESIKLSQRTKTNLSGTGSWKPGCINEIIRIAQPISWCDEQRPEWDLIS